MVDCGTPNATEIPVNKPAVPVVNSFVELMHYLRRLIEEREVSPSYQDVFVILKQLGVVIPEREIRFGMSEDDSEGGSENLPSPRWNELYEDVAEADAAAVEQAHWYCAVRSRGEFPKGWHIDNWSEWPPAPIRTPQELADYLRKRILHLAECPSQSSWWKEPAAALFQNARNAASQHWALVGLPDGEPGESVPDLIHQLDQMVRILESSVAVDGNRDELTARIVGGSGEFERGMNAEADNPKDKKRNRIAGKWPRNRNVVQCIQFLNVRMKSAQPRECLIRDFCSENGLAGDKIYESISRQVRRYSHLLKCRTRD